MSCPPHRGTTPLKPLSLAELVAKFDNAGNINKYRAAAMETRIQKKKLLNREISVELQWRVIGALVGMRTH